MNATTALREAGQRLWLDTISRQLLDSGTLQRYIDEYGVTGVTSNPTILSREITDSDQYDDALTASLKRGVTDPEQLIYEWAVSDAQRAADLLRPTWEASSALDGWVSIEVPPALAYQPDATVDFGQFLHDQTDRPNILIKVPATRPGLFAIEELTAEGVPTNATLVFDARRHRDVEDSYLRGLERRRRRGLELRVASVASVFVSRWDQATNPFLPPEWRNRIGLGIAHEIYAGQWRTRASLRWAGLAASGADPQRLVWASTSTKDPALSPTYYAERLPRAETINTMPEPTLLALQRSNPTVDLDHDSTASAQRALEVAGIDEHELAEALLAQGVQAFAADWKHLIDAVHAKVAASIETSVRAEGFAPIPLGRP
jgi:transaldolase